MKAPCVKLAVSTRTELGAFASGSITTRDFAVSSTYEYFYQGDALFPFLLAGKRMLLVFFSVYVFPRDRWMFERRARFIRSLLPKRISVVNSGSDIALSRFFTVNYSIFHIRSNALICKWLLDTKSLLTRIQLGKKCLLVSGNKYIRYFFIHNCTLNLISQFSDLLVVLLNTDGVDNLSL